LKSLQFAFGNRCQRVEETSFVDFDCCFSLRRK